MKRINIDQVLVAVAAGLASAATLGLLDPPYDRWATVIVTVIAAAARQDVEDKDPPQ